MAVADLYELTVHLTVSDTACQFGQAYRLHSGSYGIATGEAAALKWWEDKDSLLLACLSENTEIDAVRWNPIGISTELDGGIALNGANGDLIQEPIPANVCALIHLPTDAPNSKHNGRIFLPGIGEQEVQSGIIEPSEMVLLQLFADELLEEVVPDSPEDAVFVPVVISRFVLGVKRVPPVGFDIKLPIAKNAPRQQRSRMTRRVGVS